MILQSVFQRKLSALIGLEVTFEELTLSLLAGSIEFTGLKIGDVLSIARGVAKIAVSRALKGEIVVRSVTIERPVVNVRHLPKRSTPSASTASSNDDDKTRWTFDIEKVLIIDGQVNVSPRLPIEKLLLELKREGGDYKVTLLAESVVQLRGTGTISNVVDLTKVLDAPAQATLELGDLAKLRFTTPRIRSNEAEIALEGKVTLAQLLALL